MELSPNARDDLLLAAALAPLAVTELVVFGQFFVVFTLMLLLVAPAIIQFYNIVTSIEGFYSEEAVESDKPSGPPQRAGAATEML